MAIKQNDWFATLLYQPQMSIDDLFTVGITPENSSLKDRDYYKNLPAVKQAFTENDKFDETKFNSFYDSTLLAYNDYANKQSLDKVIKNYQFDPFDWRYEKESINVSPTLTLDKNPMGLSTNIKALNVITPQELSIREIAQTNKVYDVESGKWLDWTPNDKGGLWKGLFREPLVLATYDNDEEVVENGRVVHHKKGDYKYDPITGKPFYETLGNREIYDKDILRLSDTLTKENTKINQFDFFDSDGLDKSIGGSVMKLTASVAPALLGLALPEVGIVYGGISAAIALSQVIPTLGKAINGFFTNDNMNTEIGKKLNKFEAITARFGKSVSDKSREKLITFENAATLVKDVSLQLFQQRAVQYIPRLFKNNPKIYNNSDLAKTLSYAYMAGTSALESYSAFKQAGADDRVAGLGMLATTAAFYKLMSLDYFRDSFFRGSWFDDNNVKSPVWGVAEGFMDIIKNGTDDAAKAVAENTVSANQRTFKELTKRFMDAIKRTGKPWRPQPFWERTFAEGAEEVMEEFMQDGIKGMFKGAEALGIPMNDKKQDLDFGFSWNDALQRYGMSLIGGLVGGAIFQGYNNLEMRRFNNTPKTTEAHLSELVKLISDGRTDEIKSLINKWHQNQRFGSNDLSGTKLSVVYDLDGQKIVSSPRSETEMSQNDFIYQMLMDQVNYIDTVLSQEGFKNYQSKTFNLIKNKTPELTDQISEETIKFEELGLHTLFYNDLNRIATKIVDLHSKIDNIVSKYKPENDTSEAKETSENKIKNDQQIQEYEKELKALRKLRDEMFDGTWNEYYISQSDLLIDSQPLTPFLGFNNLESFIRVRYGKNATELSQAQLEIAKEEYSKYKNGKDKSIFEAIDLYRILSEEFSKDIIDAEKLLGENTSDSELNTSIIGNQYIQFISDRDKTQEEIDKLKSKENLTQEEQNTINDLQTKVDEINSNLKSYRRNPSRMLFNQTNNANSFLETIVQVLNSSRDSVDNALVDEIGNNLKQKYKDWVDKKIIKRNQSELDAFFKLFVRQSISRTDRSEVLQAVIDDIVNSTDESRWNDLISEWDPSSHTAQTELIQHIDNLYQNLQYGNLSEALNDYNKLISLLKSNGLSDSEINDLLFQDYGKGMIIGFIGNQRLNDYITEIIGYQNKLQTNLLSNLLSKLTSRINDEQISTILEMLDTEQKRLSSLKTLDDYTVSTENAENGLTNLFYVLNAIKGLLVGASNGTNADINKYRTENKFAEISKNSAITLSDEIDEYLNRIGFLLQLNSYNKQGKLVEEQRINVNMRVKFFEKLIDKIHSEPFKDAFGFDPAQLWEEDFKPIGFESIDVDNFSQFESVIISFETELYNRINGKFSNEDIVNGIMSLFGEDSEIWKEESSQLSSDSDTAVTDYDFAIYLASVLSLNSNDINTRIRDIETEKFEKTPLYGHEFSVRIAYSFLKNRNLFNRLLNSITNKYKGGDEYFSKRYNLNNILFAFGGAGTGKTTSIAALFKELVQQVDADVVYLASDKEQLDKLKTSVNAVSDSSGFLYRDFIKTIVSDQISSKNLKIESEKIVTEKALEITDDYQGDKTKSVRVIIADEIETQNEMELQVLSEYADKHNVFVLALGDYNQPTPKIKINDVLHHSGIEDCAILKTPQLNVSLRALSVAKTDNANKLFNLVNDINRKRISNPEYLDPKILKPYVEKVLKKGVSLAYYEKDKRFVGDRLISDKDVFKTTLDKILGLGGSVAIIVDETTESKYQSDKYKNLTKRADQALGGEFDYVFVDISHDENDLFGELQLFYMLTQRSRLYTAVLDEQNKISGNLNIKSVSDENSSGIIQMSSQNLAEYKRWRIDSLSKLNYSTNFEDNLSISNIIKTNPDPVVEKENPTEAEETPEVEVSNEEEPENESDGESSEESTEEKEEQTQMQQSIESKSSSKSNPSESKLKTPVSKEISTATSVSSEPEQKTESLFKEESDSTPIDMISSVNNYGSIRLDDYYNNLFGTEFIRSESNAQNSLYKKLHNGTNTSSLNRDYSSLIAQISMLAFRTTNTTNLKQMIARLLGYNQKYYSAIRNYLTTNSNIQIRLVANNKGSDIILRLYSDSQKTDNFIDIKIGESKLRRTGIYTGSFNQISGPQYTDGKRLTLRQLAEKYPALRIVPTLGVLLGDVIQNYDGSEEFGERNNGKAFVPIGELVDSLSGSEIFRAARSGGKTWTYSHSDTLRLAGIQKTLTPEEVCKILVYQDYFRNGINNPEFKSINDRRIVNLKYFGVYQNNVVNENEMLRQLSDITGNNLWLKLKSNDISKDDRNNLLNKEYIATPATMGQVFAGLFQELFSNPLGKGDSIWYALRYLLCNRADYKRLYIETSDGKKLYLKTPETKKGFSTSWEIRDVVSDKVISHLNSGSAVGPQIATVLKNLFNSAGIDLNSSRLIFQHQKQDGGWTWNNTNEDFHTLLAPFINNQQVINNLFGVFPDGFYTNIKGIDKSDCWKLTNIKESDFDKYTTRATNWKYSSFELDESKIVDETPDSILNIDKINEFNEYKSEILKITEKFLPEDVLTEISNLFTDPDSIQDMINTINDNILARTDTEYTRILEWDSWLGQVKVVSVNSYNESVNNILSDLGFNLNNTKRLTNYNTVNVLSDGNLNVYVYVENGVVKAKLTDSQDSFINAMQTVFENTTVNNAEDVDYMNRIRVEAVSFLKDFIRNSVDAKQVNSISNMNNAVILAAINNFIETYLNSEIDEC